jgi:DNA-binding NtrC family response regulator
MQAAPLLVHARYEVGAELGRGAQGVVVRVVDREAPERALVAKVWRVGRFTDSAILGEFSLLRRLDVPGLVRAHDLGHDERTGAAFFVEDFVDGQEASELLAGAAPGAARAERLFQVVAEVATTLAALHDAAFVHGDLKPAHVRVTPEGRVCLLDFGAAVASTRERDGEVTIATPAFAAPEVLAGERATARSDLFSLGALAWALATGVPPGPKPGKLRALSPWVPPSMAELVERLLQPHPRDRPESAEAVLGSLGLTGLASARRVVPAPVGRERELLELGQPRVGVRYLVGPSGVGKSHLLREVATRALLAGREVRRVAFPSTDALLVSELVTFLRGASAAWPFTERRTAGATEAVGSATPTLLVLDELHAAPAELVAALDAYRCRGAHGRALDVIGALREAPEGSEQLSLGPLAAAPFAELCARLGVSEPLQVAKLAQVTRHNPGWLVAANGRVPLTRDMVLERTRELSKTALELLATLALFGGIIEEALLERASSAGVGGGRPAADELLAAGLVTRRSLSGAAVYALQVPELASEIAAALGSFELSEQAASLALGDDSQTPRALLTLASSPFPNGQRERLLEQAVNAAERAGLAGEQADALLALAASPAQRSPALLRKLERLLRSAGTSQPEVLQWLADAAEREPALAPLCLRRQAEQAARSGNFELAERCAGEAEARAAEQGDRLTEALALATRGAVALFRADVVAAERALLDARARLATFDVADREELARLDHNLGVVALYADRIDDAVQAFERSLVIKRQLGDRAGVRSCLLNLGLALARRGDHDAAARTLTEAHALARALRQNAGRAWCLAALADVEVRRNRPLDAERFIAEAEAIAEAPPAIRADLSLLRGQLALLRGNAAAARQALDQLEPALRASDAMVDARAKLIEAGAWLASLPAAPRRAARLAIAAARVARTARLPEVEARALELLRRARSGAAKPVVTRYASAVPDADPAVWNWLEQVAGGAGGEASVVSLLRALCGASAAERVLLVVGQASGAPVRAWGVDFEGFELPSALERCDPSLISAAFEAPGPHYLRDVATSAGRGSRLTLALPGAAPALLLFEHRFRPSGFDAVGAEQLQRWGVAAALALRLVATAVAAPALPGPAQVASDSLPSTAVPAREARRHFANIIGSSRALRAALARLDSAIDSELPVLIAGETGTGKELFARALHELGPRAQAPFVAVNCGAIPDALFEAELFGHARGAFTGAERPRAGLIARAEGGTLFLDEIGELPLARQAALLRVLEARRFRAVGSDEERACDVRIVAATNRVLKDEVARGAFRQDLLYRINVIEVLVPPLRERREDMALLVQSFLARAKSEVTLDPEVFAALEAQPWPGNVRELEHQIQRLLALGVRRVELGHLPRELRRGVSLSPSAAAPDESAGDPRADVQRAVHDAGGNITHAARALGLTRHGLKKRMLRLGLRVAASEGEHS